MEYLAENALYYVMTLDGVGLMLFALAFLAPNMFFFGLLSGIGAAIIQVADYLFGG